MGLIDELLVAIFNSDSGQMHRAVNPELDRQCQEFERRAEQRRMRQRLLREEQRLKQRQQQNQSSSNNDEGCFVTTAVCESFGKPDDCYELTTFRKFRDGWLAFQPDGKDLIAEYYAIAPKIVEKINRLADSAQIYKNIWQRYLEPCLNFIKSGDNLACKNKYVEMVRELKKIYG